jgi:hypothetical protein
MSPQGRPKGEFPSAQREGLLASAGMHAHNVSAVQALQLARPRSRGGRYTLRCSRTAATDVTAGAVAAFAAQAFSAASARWLLP